MNENNYSSLELIEKYEKQNTPLEQENFYETTYLINQFIRDLKELRDNQTK
jgi:hypothetical protein